MIRHGDDFLDNRRDLAAAIIRRDKQGRLVVGGVRNPRTQREVEVVLGKLPLDVDEKLRDTVVDLLTAVLDEVQERFRLGRRYPHDNAGGEYPPIDPDQILGAGIQRQVRPAQAAPDAGQRKRAV